jgi:hypothetical protein
MINMQSMRERERLNLVSSGLGGSGLVRGGLLLCSGSGLGLLGSLLFRFC